MKAIEYLKQKGFDVEPDLFSGEQAELRMTGNEIAHLMEQYADVKKNAVRMWWDFRWSV